MGDFETHPVGTADLVKRLRDEHVAASRTEAADRIEQLEAALTRANAATAAAFEAAANVLDDEIDMARIAFPQAVPILAADRKAIRALATPDQTAALDRLIAEAVRPLINAVDAMLAAFCVHENSAQIAAYAGMMNAILAASKKGGV